MTLENAWCVVQKPSQRFPVYFAWPFAGKEET